ncbi:MAG TPA: L,D-transpeptidase [Methylibium sp.]|uniref:L,D-transpeptidase n=1 Tax=Methylibium sp. TaxID=2067992 RepID=UPI002DB64941|nr:L,D-transpeptidase [Methylibium sp.]HEU4459527.1 L,D-transpeptidase [Methylibium sp.]
MWAAQAAVAAPPAPPAAPRAAPDAIAPAEPIERLAAMLRGDRERRGRPYAVVDKRTATLRVWRADGTLAGISTVLIGRTPGDRALPGTGARTEAGLLSLDDMTTPAGRYDSEPGRNLQGEAIVWLDYDNALAIHRLRPGASQAERLRRLASALPADKRASAGCVVVPVAFYDGVVAPLLGRGRGWVVVLPENGAVEDAASVL